MPRTSNGNTSLKLAYVEAMLPGLGMRWRSMIRGGCLEGCVAVGDDIMCPASDCRALDRTNKRFRIVEYGEPQIVGIGIGIFVFELANQYRRLSLGAISANDLAGIQIR